MKITPQILQERNNYAKLKIPKMDYTQYPLQPQYYQYPQLHQTQPYFNGYCMQYNPQQPPLYPINEIIPYMGGQTIQQPKECYGCLNGIQNQEGHYGGCIEDPNMREYIEFPSASSDTTLTPEVPQEPSLEFKNKDYEEDQEYIDILKLTKTIWTPKQHKNFFKNPILACKLDKYSCEILNKYNEYINVNIGDWIYTNYQIPLDCLHESKLRSYLQDYIFKATPEIAEKLEHSIGSEVRYNVAPNGRFQIPRENGEFYYGHPALYDPKTQSRIEATSEQSKYLKRGYEKNQKRISTIANVFPIKHYEI